MLLRLGALAVAILAMYSGMLLSGHSTPKLGLDLQGGTTVTLTPKTLNGKKPASGAINQAVDIIRQRVNGFGVSEADVKRAGDTIEISVPGKGRSVVDQVGQTAQLDFREVLTSQQVALPTSPTASPTKAPFSAAPTAVPTTPGTGNSPATGTPAPKVSSSPTAPAAATTPVAPGSSAHSERRPLGPGMQLDAYHAAASPSAPASAAAKVSASPSAAPKATATPAPAVSAADTPPAAAIAAYTKLDCVKDSGPPAGTLDQPAQWLATCGQGEAAGTKYLLKPAKVIGTDVKSADATLGQGNTGTSNGQWEVNINFTGRGQSRWTNLTKATVGKNVGVVLDNRVVSAPVIENVIYGSAQITGSFSQSQANNLANVLKYGALPLSFDKSSAESISASLGRSSLHAGLLAGAIGLALVIVYSFVYYRALGFVVIASLVISGLMVYALVVLLGQAIGFTLSLAGIAGLIVSVGITADSFVVFFERLKDEVREGRTVRSGVERGWVRARRTILSADTVSFLAAACLYILSIGSVRGFAFTLGLSTLLDIATVFLFTRPIVTLLVRRSFFSTGRASGLMVRNAPPPAPVGVRRVGTRPAAAGVARAVAPARPNARPTLRKEV